jgi:hypothetical protein
MQNTLTVSLVRQSVAISGALAQLPVLHHSARPSPQAARARRLAAGVPHAALLTLVLLSLAAAHPLARASDPIGIYAFIDRVVLEPNEKAPERIQLHGAFCFAKRPGNLYGKPERGYLYYALDPEKPEVCRKEWADFKAIAGTGQIVGFASRYEDKGQVRKASERPAKADRYPLAWGLSKARRGDDYEPVRLLRAVRGSETPADGDGNKRLPEGEKHRSPADTSIRSGKLDAAAR